MYGADGDVSGIAVNSQRTLATLAMQCAVRCETINAETAGRRRSHVPAREIEPRISFTAPSSRNGRDNVAGRTASTFDGTLQAGAGLTIPRMSTLPKIHARRALDPTGRFRAEEIDLEFSNGERRTFERLQSSTLGAVIIVPLQNDDTVLLVREYAAGLHRYELGLPKGRIDPGENALIAADRELKEEAGFGARDLHWLVSLALAPSYMSHRTQVVLARELYPERLPGDEPEELEVVPWPLDQLNDLIGHPECSEGRTLAALFIAREFLAGRWQPPADPDR